MKNELIKAQDKVETKDKKKFWKGRDRNEKMIMKIKESLTHNVGVKIVAVIIATLIWLTVINITDPEKL